MSGDIGMNIRGGGLSNENAARFILEDLRPKSSTVINESKLMDLLIKGKLEYPIFRMKGTGIQDDDSAYSKHDAAEFARALHNLAPPGAMLYGGNEFGSEGLDRQDDWTNRFVEECVRLDRKPVVHCQFTYHPITGRDGIAKLKSSTRAAIQAGGGIGPHIYYSTSPDAELKNPRNAFSVLQEWRDVCGDDFPIFVTEFGCAWNGNSRDGYLNHISQTDYFEHTKQAAEICSRFGAYLQVYGIFPSGTEWDTFNVWFADEYKRLASQWNGENEMATQVFDMWKYLGNNGKTGKPYLLLGFGYEACQLQAANGYSYTVKNHAAETRWADDQYVYLGLDTSMINDPNRPSVYSLFTGDRYGSAWLPRKMKIGDVFRREADVRVYEVDGTPRAAGSGHATSYMKFVKYHASKLFRLSDTDSIEIADLVELLWTQDLAGTQKVETYWYAAGYGLVGFRYEPTGQMSQISANPPSAPPSRTVLNWFREPVPPPVALGTAYPPGTNPVDAYVSISDITLRSLPTKSGPIIRSLLHNERVTVYEQPSVVADDLTWIRAKTQRSEEGWCAQYVFIGGKKTDTFLPFSAPPVPPTSSLKLSSPLPGGVITAHFGAPRDYDGDGIKDDKHEGTDYALAENLCAIGKVNVVASAAGKVISVRDYLDFAATGKFTVGYGVYVKIQHDVDGQIYVTWYCHLSSPLVCKGDIVEQGQPIGVIGSLGNSTGYHVHLNLQWIGHGLSGYVITDAVDPEKYMLP